MAEKEAEKKISTYTMVRIKKTIKEMAAVRAGEQHRSIANYIENLVLRDNE